MTRSLDGAPHEIDVYVGARLRARRKALSVSQATLAERVRLTFQQIQKYERGSNRISASMLVLLADALDADVSYFFEGLRPGRVGDNSRATEAVELIDRVLSLPEGQVMARAFLDIPSSRMRRVIAEFVEKVADQSRTNRR